MAKPWAKGSRRSGLPRDWPARVARVKARDGGRCTARHHVAECDGKGTDVDHVIPGNDHRIANLALMSGPCHDAKTELERQQGIAARDARLRRPPEPPPGLKPQA